MERKDFLKNALAFAGITTVVAEACKKSATDAIATTNVSDAEAASCILSPTEEQGPFPYPGGEINNPLNRTDVRETQTGKHLTLNFLVVNVNNNCAVVPNARVDIWHCNKDGYYSGYANQPGYLGTKSYVGQTWLRGYQTSDANGKVTFQTIYPGWYGGRATHIHFEVFVNNVLKKIGQLAFDETITNQVYATKLYKAHGTNPVTNSTDHVFGDSTTDLANETGVISSKDNRLICKYTIGVGL